MHFILVHFSRKIKKTEVRALDLFKTDVFFFFLNTIILNGVFPIVPRISKPEMTASPFCTVVVVYYS